VFFIRMFSFPIAISRSAMVVPLFFAAVTAADNARMATCKIADRDIAQAAARLHVGLPRYR
jgi:hypothetical protein